MEITNKNFGFDDEELVVIAITIAVIIYIILYSKCTQ